MLVFSAELQLPHTALDLSRRVLNFHGTFHWHAQMGVEETSASAIFVTCALFKFEHQQHTVEASLTHHLKK